MEGFRKLLNKPDSGSDKKSDGGERSSAKMRLGRFRLKMKMMSNLGFGRQSAQSVSQPTVLYENTYKLEPESSKRFSTAGAEKVIEGVFENYLKGRKYDPKTFPRLVKTLTDLIKDRVKAQGVERYKIIATVTIVENKEQGLQLSSRALWNDHYDNYASLAYEGPNFYAIGSVYGIYYD